MINKTIYNGGVGGFFVPTHTTTNLDLEKELNLKIFCLKCLKNSIYRNILYICFERGFIYKKELEKLVFGKITNHLELLLNYGIIKETNINNEFANFLYSQNGYNYYNVNKIKLYCFTEFGFQIYKKYKSFIYSKTTKRVIEHLKNISKTKEEQKAKEILRYNIIKSKSLNCRTIDDHIFLEQFKKKLENGKIK
jgi:hypothetical protein